jgi:CRP-like cAMP-binding protein
VNEGTLYDFVASDRLASAVEKWAHQFEPSANGILFRQGDESDGVYYLKAGEATLTMHVAGKPQMSMRVAAGSLLGLPAIVGNMPYSLTAKVEGRADVYKIGCDEFKQMIARNSRLCSDVLRILACEVHSARVALGKLMRTAQLM